MPSFSNPHRVVRLFRLVPPSTRKSLFVRRFRDQRVPPYRLVMCSTTQQGPNLAPICGTTRDPAVQRACPQPRSHSSHWRSTAALPSAHPDTTSDRLNHDRKSLHSRPNRMSTSSDFVSAREQRLCQSRRFRRRMPRRRSGVQARRWPGCSCSRCRGRSPAAWRSPASRAPVAAPAGSPSSGRAAGVWERGAACSRSRVWW